MHVHRAGIWVVAFRIAKEPLAYDKPGVLSSGLKIALRFSESTRI